MKRSTLFGFAGLFLVVLAGCAHHTDDEHTDSTSMKLETSCSQTLCDSLQAEQSSEVSECFDAADEADLDPSGCDVSFSSCTDEDRKTCSSTNWTFDVRAPADASYQTACERSRDHLTSCGVTVTDRANCAIYAQVERPENERFYDAITAAPCDQVANVAATVDPAPGTFGTEICNRFAELSSSRACPADQIAALNAEAGWLRDDVIAAGRGCLKAIEVEDLNACLTKWLDAVDPPTTSD